MVLRLLARVSRLVGSVVVGATAGGVPIGVASLPEVALAASTQNCEKYFTDMTDEVRRLAKVCADNAGLLHDGRDSIGFPGSPTEDGDYAATRQTASELFLYLEPADPRWTIVGDEARPNCLLPLKVDSQKEAFTECTRVYICGMRAASCGLAVAGQVKVDQCTRISAACLEEFPVPHGLENVRPAPDTELWENHRRALEEAYPPSSPGPDYSKSGISGPSPRSGGGHGVPAQSAK
jgi:hypothetical protein